MPLPQSRRVPLPERGVEIALLDWGGDGPLLFMHHANGFCAATLGLVAERLTPRFRVIGMDARGHGDSSKPEGPTAYQWDQFAEDYLAVAHRLADEHGGPVGVGFGHSFGGTSALGAAARAPELFECLFLVDPVVPFADAASDPDRPARMKRMIEGAQKRRSSWPSRDAARAHFAERSLFERWLPEAIDLYVDHGLREGADGSRELKCPGAVEAAVFANGGAIDVEALARDARSVPTSVLWAKLGNFSLPVYRRVFGAMERAEIREIDAGHLMPMERPDLVADEVFRAWREGA